MKLKYLFEGKIIHVELLKTSQHHPLTGSKNSVVVELFVGKKSVKFDYWQERSWNYYEQTLMIINVANECLDVYNHVENLAHLSHLTEADQSALRNDRLRIGKEFLKLMGGDIEAVKRLIIKLGQ